MANGEWRIIERPEIPICGNCHAVQIVLADKK
jgi:hypothetical protein